MKTLHILRKYRPDEWGGTETAVKGLLDGLRAHGVQSEVAAPAANILVADDPIARSGHTVQRFKAFLPVVGLKREQKAQLLAVGGNLMSFELFWRLWSEPKLDLIHSHALNRLGGIALRVARMRKIPCVITIHGGYLDLPETVRQTLVEPLRGALEWGKIFGPFLRSRHVVSEADAVITCNPREAEKLRDKFPHQRVLVQPHGVPVREFATPRREAALTAFPRLQGRQVLLVLGRIDPTKNQGWVIQEMPAIREQFPNTVLVCAGAVTDEGYGKSLKKEIRRLGLEEHVFMVGGLPPMDARLIGLMQQATAVVVPSLSETFGLTILEAWAARQAVISTNTSGALSLIQDRQNGLLFDLSDRNTFREKVAAVLSRPDWARTLGEAGHARAAREYDTTALAGRVKQLYAELIEKAHETRHHSRRRYERTHTS